MTVLNQPTPDQTAVDLANGLLGNAEPLTDDALRLALGDQQPDSAHAFRVEFRHSMSLAAVVGSVQALVSFVRALIAPREMPRVAASTVSAKVTRGVSGWARAVELLSNHAMRVCDSLLSAAKTYASVALTEVAGERPAFVGVSGFDACPKSFVKRPTHRVNSSRRRYRA